LRPIMFEFYHVLTLGQTLGLIWLVFLTFWLFSPIFSTMFWMQLGLLHLLITSVPWCVCTHPINPMGIHLLRCTRGNKHTRTHDIVRDTFATIAWDASFHVGRE
jgi:hypothetical protein